jgi:hypothetical protein
LVHIPCALEYEDFPSSDERSFLFGHESWILRICQIMGADGIYTA